MKNGLRVPSGPNRVVTMLRVSTQSWMWAGSTSKSAMNMNQKPENSTRKIQHVGLRELAERIARDYGSWLASPARSRRSVRRRPSR